MAVGACASTGTRGLAQVQPSTVGLEKGTSNARGVRDRYRFVGCLYLFMLPCSLFPDRLSVEVRYLLTAPLLNSQIRISYIEERVLAHREGDRR